MGDWRLEGGLCTFWPRCDELVDINLAVKTNPARQPVSSSSGGGLMGVDGGWIGQRRDGGYGHLRG